MKKIFFSILFFLAACSSSPEAQRDLYVDAQNARATADAARDLAEYQERFLTATAEAPIIHITETAAAAQVAATTTADAMAVQQRLWTATAQSVQSTETAAMTHTAQAWTPTPNATMTVVFAQAYAESTKQANLAIEDDQRIERVRLINKAKAFSIPLLAIVVLILSVARAYVAIKRFAFIPHAVDENGKATPMIGVIDGVAWDIERAANGMIGTGREFLKQLPQITAERQDAVTERAQRVDMATRARLPRRLLEEQSRGKLALPKPEENPLLIDYPLPEWSVWMQKWTPGHLALGINEKGLLQADPENDTHFLFAGTTGSWKSRGGMRVIATCALASGWQVIIAGKELDYKVFESHPNAQLAPFSLLSDPIKAIELLRGVYAEIERRNRMMSQRGYSLWSQTGQTQTLVMIDEFSNLSDALEDIDSARKKELWRWARMDTAESRKYGIHMAYALQDPTGQSIDLRIRRNTTPVMFRVKESASSRTLLNVNGAEKLSVRHFLANMTRLERGAAFAPTDEEIMQFLNAHPVREAEQPLWIEGLTHTSELPESKQGSIEAGAPRQSADESMGEFVNSLDEKGLKVMELYQAGGLSNADIEYAAYGYSNGRSARMVTEIIERYRRIQGINTTTTATTTERTPDLNAATADFSSSVVVEPLEDVETRIRKILKRMIAENKVSLSQVEREVFGETKGGSQFRQVQAIYIEMKKNTSTTTQTPPNLSAAPA